MASQGETEIGGPLFEHGTRRKMDLLLLEAMGEVIGPPYRPLTRGEAHVARLVVAHGGSSLRASLARLLVSSKGSNAEAGRGFKERADHAGGRTGLGDGEVGLRSAESERAENGRGSRQFWQSRGRLGFDFGLETLLHARDGASRCNSCIPFAEVWNAGTTGVGCPFLGIRLCRPPLRAGSSSRSGPQGTYQDSARQARKVSRVGWGVLVGGSHGCTPWPAWRPSPAGALGRQRLGDKLTLAQRRPELELKIHRFG